MNFVELYRKEIDSVYLNDDRKELLLFFLNEMSKKKISEIRSLSFHDIANIVHKKPYDNETFELINFLESPRISFLIRRHIFIDDSCEEEIDQEDLEEIVSQNKFIHPETGEPVKDWKNHIFPFFTISPKVKEQAE